MRILFSLVLYRHSLETIRPLLVSIQRLAYLSAKYECFLNIYNASPHALDDPSPSRVHYLLPDVALSYQYGKNVGFGAANNINFESHHSNDTFLFIVVNPDIEFQPYPLILLLDWLEDKPHVSCVSPLILNSGENIQYSAKHNPTALSLLIGRIGLLRKIPLLAKYDKWHRNLSLDYRRDCFPSTYLSGCFLIIPSTYYRYIGGFCERYFLHLEDADIVRRLSLHGYCLHNPLGVVRHRWARGSHSSARQMISLVRSFFIYSSEWGVSII